MLGKSPDRNGGPQQSQPVVIPPLRTWEVVRRNPYTSTIETVEIKAHSIEYNEAGIAFQQAYLHESGQIVVQMRYGISAGEWLEFVETTPIPVVQPLQSPSSLLIQ